MYYILPFIMGLAIAIQAPLNAYLGKNLLNSPLLAALISFLVGSVILLCITALNGNLNSNALKALAQQHWWEFMGGVLGAFFVFGTILLAPKIGVLPMFLIVLLGQLITSMLLDNFGAFGLSVKPVSLERILGLAVIILGLCIFFFRDIKSLLH